MTWDLLMPGPFHSVETRRGFPTEEAAVAEALALADTLVRTEIDRALGEFRRDYPETPLPQPESVLPEIVPERRAIGDESGNVVVLLLTPGAYRTRDDEQPMLAFKARDVREYWVVPSQYTERIVERTRADDLARMHRLAEQGAFDG